MAFVILSAGTVAQSRMRTISTGAFVGMVTLVVGVVLAGGFALGYGYSRSMGEEIRVPEVAIVEQSPGRHHLIDRFGEMAGRLAQLEAEAVDLAARIGTIKEFESRAGSDTVQGKQRSRLARTPPGAPAGGPMLRPETEDAASFTDAQSDDTEGSERLTLELERMERDLARVAGSFDELDELATSYHLAYLSFPGRAPLPGARTTSSFGKRIDPFKRRLAFHSGVDFPAPKGTPILASAGGRVIFSGYRSEYGYTVEIEHVSGLVTRYAHASKLHVKTGQIVMPGQKIAAVGSTGRSTGPHLHFEVLKDGRFADPARYLARF